MTFPHQSPKQGFLSVFQSKPNLSLATDRTLFLFRGDATTQRIEGIISEDGIPLPARSAGLDQGDFHLTVYHFNDLHGHLVRFSPAGEDPVISRMAGKVSSHHQKVSGIPNQAVITLTAGDDCIGSIFDELLGSTSEDFQVHASYALYSAMGVDAACLGNHDFDLGSGVLKRSIQKNAKFPILAANVHGCSEIQSLCFPAALLVVKGVRIGLIGVLTQAELKESDPDCKVTHPVTAINNLLPALKPFCDVVIVISHLGLSLSQATIPMVNSGDVELAQRLPANSVHLIVGGHSHHELNSQGLSAGNIVNGIPIVQAGSLGKYLGMVDIRVTKKGSVVSNVRLLPTSNLPQDAIFEREHIQPLLERARTLFSRSLGKVEENPKLSTEHVRSTLALEESALANFITDGIVSCLEHQSSAVDLAMVDASSIRQGLRPGEEVTLGEWFNIMPFADTIKIYRLRGSQLKALVNDNARRMDRPNEPHTERGFLHFSKQIRYQVILGRKRSEAKAIHITVNNKPIDQLLDQEFFIAGTSFIREYAHSWEIINRQQEAFDLIDLHNLQSVDTDLFLRRELVNFIQEKGGITSETGAIRDGRMIVLEEDQIPVTSLALSELSQHVSQQNHAMAGAVIANSALQAVSLGLACLNISQQKMTSLPENLPAMIENLSGIQANLLQQVDQDADAIRLLVEARSRGNSMPGKELLCQLPARIAQESIDSALILQQARSWVFESVADDLEMSIVLLGGSAKAAILLLDSNLRIWQDAELVNTFQPQFEELWTNFARVTPIERIRREK